MKEFIINLVLIFIVKVIDNILGTSKTILIQKNKSFIASITVVVSQIIFYKLINVVDGNDGELMIYVIAVASGLGTLLALHISNKFSKDRVCLLYFDELPDDTDIFLDTNVIKRHNKVPLYNDYKKIILKTN